MSTAGLGLPPKSGKLIIALAMVFLFGFAIVSVILGWIKDDKLPHLLIGGLIAIVQSVVREYFGSDEEPKKE